MRLTTIEVAPERASEWEDVWREIHAVYQQHPGFRSARLLRNADRPGHYVLQTEWEERTHANDAFRVAGMIWIARGLGLWEEHAPVVYLEPVDDAAGCTGAGRMTGKRSG